MSSLPFSAQQMRDLPWHLREYMDLHLAVLNRPQSLLERLKAKHGLREPPAIQSLLGQTRANYDLQVNIPDHDPYYVECKSEQNPTSYNTAIELLTHLNEQETKNKLGWKRNGARTCRENSPHVFDNLPALIQNSPKRGLGTAELPSTHYSSLWRRTRSTNVHRLFPTRALQFAIENYLQEPEAEIAFSPTGNTLFVLIPETAFCLSPFREALLVEDHNLEDLTNYCDQKCRLEVMKNSSLADKYISHGNQDQTTQLGASEHQREAQAVSTFGGGHVRAAGGRVDQARSVICRAEKAVRQSLGLNQELKDW